MSAATSWENKVLPYVALPNRILSYTKIRKNSKTQSIRILKNAAPACSFPVLPWCRRLCQHTSCAALSSRRACVTSRPVGCRRMAEAEFGRGHTLPRWQSYANKTYVDAIKLQIRQPFLQNCASACTSVLSSSRFFSRLKSVSFKKTRATDFEVHPKS